MLDAPFGRVHTLALRRDDRGVFCGLDGLFVNSIPLLDSEPVGGGRKRFAPRPLADLNRDLERCYGLPVDATAKFDGIGAVARALNDGDPARACIAAVFLRLPEAPDFSGPSLMKCAAALSEIGLLKADPRDAKHPGFPKGTPGGKGGQFRPKTAEEKALQLARPEQLIRGVLTKIAADLAKKVVADILAGTLGAALGPEVPVAETAKLIFDLGYATYEMAELVAPYVRAYFDAPKPLAELRQAAKTGRNGYDIHHIVERYTRAADGSEDDYIDGPENLASIPKLKHWDLSSWLQNGHRKYDGLTPRQYVNGKNLAERRRVGLFGLEEIGVLKP
jgi:hypothetical protein